MTTTRTAPDALTLTPAQKAIARRAAETNAMTFDMTGIKADRSRNFSRSGPRTTSKRKTIR